MKFAVVSALICLVLGPSTIVLAKYVEGQLINPSQVVPSVAVLTANKSLTVCLFIFTEMDFPGQILFSLDERKILVRH